MRFLVMLGCLVGVAGCDNHRQAWRNFYQNQCRIEEKYGMNYAECYKILSTDFLPCEIEYKFRSDSGDQCFNRKLLEHHYGLAE